MTLLGFSLGGNVMLKFAGELGLQAQELCTQVIAVCPPADLAACSRLLSQPSNRLYERYFMRRLLAAVAERHRLFPDLAPVNLPVRLSLYQFDNLYTAPQCGLRRRRRLLRPQQRRALGAAHYPAVPHLVCQ